MHIEGKIVNCEPDVLLKVCLRQVVSSGESEKGLPDWKEMRIFAHIY